MLANAGSILGGVRKSGEVGQIQSGDGNDPIMFFCPISAFSSRDGWSVGEANGPKNAERCSSRSARIH